MNNTSHSSRLIVLAVAVLVTSSVGAQEWKEFIVSNMTHPEYSPSVSGSTVVWDVTNSFGDRDVWGADISDPNRPEAFLISAGPGNERFASVSGNQVVWQNKPFGVFDWDIMGMDLGHPQQISYTITATPENDYWPVISGPNVVWQHEGLGRNNTDVGWASLGGGDSVINRTPLATPNDDLDPTISGNRVIWKQVRYQPTEVSCMGADISDVDNIGYFDVDLQVGLYQLPKLDGDWVVAIDSDENGTLWAKNLADSSDPVLIADSNGKQIARPDIAGDIVVWEDDRSGDWDIYGYNLSSKTEFPLVIAPGDQEKPSIYTDPNEGYYVVVWQDRRDGNPDIYGAIMQTDGAPTEPGCTSPPPWDINKDCQIDFLDFAILAEHWLEEIE